MVDASGGVLVGPGYFRLDEPDHEPILIEQALGEARWDRKNRQFVFPVLKLKTKEVELVGEGTLAPPAPLDALAKPSADRGDIWTGSAHLVKPARFAGERPGEDPLVIDRGALRLSFQPADKKVFVERFEASGPQINATGALAFDLEERATSRFQSHAGQHRCPRRHAAHADAYRRPGAALVARARRRRRLQARGAAQRRVGGRFRRDAL